MGNEDSDEKSKMREDILEGNIKRWDIVVDPGTQHVKCEGYFGNFTIITVGGKKMLVFADPRESFCEPMLAEWYDEIEWTAPWNPDTRFVSNPNREPLLVKKGEKWTIVCYYGKKIIRGRFRQRVPETDEWYDKIFKKENVQCLREDGSKASSWADTKTVERWYDAVKDGLPVRITERGCAISDNNPELLKEVKTWDKDRIKTDWIEKGRPCYHISGFRYRGAKPGRISTEKALEMIKIHSFGMGFSSMSWAVEDGSVALVFESYSELDME